MWEEFRVGGFPCGRSDVSGVFCVVRFRVVKILCGRSSEKGRSPCGRISIWEYLLVGEITFGEYFVC